MKFNEYGVQPLMDTPSDVGAGAGIQTTPVATPQGNEVNTGAGAQPVNNTALDFEIDGVGKVTPDQIKEWRLGNMRQSDYTRKTQELAKQREEMKDAVELFNYLRSNPQVAQGLANGDYTGLSNSPVANKLNPVANQVRDIGYEMATMKLDMQLENLKRMYPDFNEVEVLTEADKMNVTDLEFVYNGLKGKKTGSLEVELRKKIEAELTEKIRNNSIMTQTILNTNDAPVNNGSFGLSEAEMAIATKMGISPEKYAKGKG